jgi:hypothetical protein
VKKPHPLFYAWGVLWSSPLTLIGIVAALLYLPRSVRWSEGCIEVVCTWILFKPQAQTLGIVKCCRDVEARDSSVLRVHERCHVVQAFYGSVFYGAVWLLHWLWNAIIVRPDGSGFPKWLPVRDEHGKLAPWWWRAYLLICWERQAYRIDYEFAIGERPKAWGARP